MTKENDRWPVVIFIAVGQQYIFFFKSRRKETCKF
jgi:hypothetical protein